VKEKQNIWLPALLLAVFALTRWPGFFPNEWKNFSAAYALAFCAGVYFPGRIAWPTALGTLFLTNVLLNLFYYRVPVLNSYMLITLGAFGVIVWLGQRFNRRSAWLKLVCGGLLGAVLFYLITNTAAWIYEPTQPYAKTLAGWFQALTVGTAGWPETWTFFRNTLLSGGLFTGLFAGAMKLSENLEAAEEETEEHPTDEKETPSPEETKA